MQRLELLTGILVVRHPYLLLKSHFLPLLSGAAFFVSCVLALFKPSLMTVLHFV